MSIDPKFVEHTADVLKIYFLNTNTNHYSGEKQNMYIHIHIFQTKE